jgi:hypothetical protein
LEQDFSLTVADTLGGISLSNLLPLSDSATEILGESETIRLDCTETDEIRAAMINANPSTLWLQNDTELDLSRASCSKLRFVVDSSA